MIANNYSCLALAIFMILTSCAEVIEGSTQTIEVDTAPQGANCTFESNGKIVNTLPSTPGSVIIKKTKYDLLIHCSKPGEGEGAIRDDSGFAAANLGNIPFGVLGLVGGLTDGITGASNKYDTPVFITLQKP